MVVGDGELMFDINHEGRGWSNGKMSGLWDDEHAASDPRSRYRGKEDQ